MRRWHWVSAYVATSALGLSMAYLISMSLLAPAHSQQAPSDGSLPPEFMSETAAPAAPASPPVAAPAPVPAAPANGTAVAPSSGTAVGAEQYVYDPAGRRDPFRPYRMVRSSDEKKAAGEVAIEPLQKYDLDQLTLIGILWDVRQPRALIRDSDGNFHTIVKSTKLGRYNGYVAAIREGEIVVVESIEDEGKPLRRTKIMEFKK
ncbi:MAG: pilus assembly protein PilP [Bdellovibrionaceae bacterium]|nr:pilus assembly protein PilP [Pseudobdellovibrionaceae bacterium]